MAEARGALERADPGAAGAGAVPDYPAPGDPSLGAEALPAERGGGGRPGAVSSEAACWDLTPGEEWKCSGSGDGGVRDAMGFRSSLLPYYILREL